MRNEKVTKAKVTKVEERDYGLLDVLGSSGLNQQGGIVNEEWLRQLEGQQGVKTFTEMKDNDPVIGAILYAIKTLVRQTAVSVEPSGDSESHKEKADFVQSCLDDMEITWQDFVAEVLSFLPYGWSYFEELFKFRKGQGGDPRSHSKHNDGKIGWRKFGIRSQDTLYRWEISDEGAILGMWQMAPPTYSISFIPIEKALLFRTDTHKNNPEGRSILRNCHRSWWFCKRIQEIEAIGIERDLAGLPVMQVPVELLASSATSAQKAVVDDFRDMIQKIRRDEYEGIVIPSETDIDGNPSGFKLSLLSSGGRRPLDVNEIIKRYESRIAMSVLGEFVMLGVDGTGSYSLASNKTAMFAQALGTYLQSIAATINQQAIPRLMKLNGWHDPDFYPKLTFADIEKTDVGEIATALQGLTTAGLITPDDELEKWVRDFANLPAPDAESFTEPDTFEPLDTASQIDTPDATATDATETDATATDTETDITEDAERVPVSAVTLNGAQVSSLLEIINRVTAGMLPRDSALEIIVTAFNVPKEKADSMLGTVGRGFEPTNAVEV